MYEKATLHFSSDLLFNTMLFDHRSEHFRYFKNKGGRITNSVFVIFLSLFYRFANRKYSLYYSFHLKTFPTQICVCAPASFVPCHLSLGSEKKSLIVALKTIFEQ